MKQQTEGKRTTHDTEGLKKRLEAMGAKVTIGKQEGFTVFIRSGRKYAQPKSAKNDE